MNIGAAIVTHNNTEDIESCIASLVHEGLQHIAIIDSASHDGTAEKIAKLAYPHELLLENKGFGYAANKAARLLNTEYVLFLNPDAVLLPGALAHGMKTMQQCSQAGIVGLLLCDSAGAPEYAAYGNEPTLPRLLMRRIYRAPMPLNLFSVGWVSGGAFIISHKLFRHIGGFDESFFLYWEDIDVCKRVRDAGYDVVVDASARVKHVRGGSKLPDREKTAIYDASADRYYKKHYSTTIWAIQRFLRKMYRL